MTSATTRRGAPALSVASPHLPVVADTGNCPVERTDVTHGEQRLDQQCPESHDPARAHPQTNGPPPSVSSRLGSTENATVREHLVHYSDPVSPATDRADASAKDVRQRQPHEPDSLCTTPATVDRGVV